MRTPRKSRVRAGFAGSLSGKARKPPIDRTKIEVGALVYLRFLPKGGSASDRRKADRKHREKITAAKLFVVAGQEDEVETGWSKPWWFVAKEEGVENDFHHDSLRVYAPATPTRLALCKLGRPDLAYRADWPEHLPKPWEEEVVGR